MDGAASLGTDTGWAAGDHTHPTVFQFTYVAASADATLTDAQVATYALYLYGDSPTAATLTMPVATTPVRVWQAMNITDHDVTLQGSGGGTITLQTRGNMEVWTDGYGIYPLNTIAVTPGAGDKSQAVANTSWVANNLTGHSDGISFGTTTVNDPLDLSRHISLYDAWGGFSITGGNLNVVANATRVLSFDGNGLWVVAGQYVQLGRDPQSALEAATKQYVDNAVAAVQAKLGASQWDMGAVAEFDQEAATNPLDEMRATIAALTARIAALESRPAP
jgi:hypothetical protein